MNDSPTGRSDLGEPGPLMERILYEVKKVVVGQDHFLERVMVAILAQGHLLVEGVPGLAKTLTVKTLARTVRGTFRRIQFTPDLVPADLVGTRIYNQKTGEFTTSLGPVFTNLLLADEINRAPGQGAKRAARSDAGIPGHHRRADAPCAGTIPGHGDAESDRNRRHLPAARGPGGPVHDEGAGRLPERGRGDRHRQPRHRRDARSRRRSHHRRTRRIATRMPNGIRGSVTDALCGAPHQCHTQSRALRHSRHRALPVLRRKPARDHPPDRGRAGARRSCAAAAMCCRKT